MPQISFILHFSQPQTPLEDREEAAYGQDRLGSAREEANTTARTDQRHLLKEKPSPHVQTPLNGKVLCLVVPTLIQGEFCQESVGRDKELISIPSVSHGHISINPAAASPAQAQDLHTHIRNVFGCSWSTLQY